jgi:hypothetical protein
MVAKFASQAWLLRPVRSQRPLMTWPVAVCLHGRSSMRVTGPSWGDCKPGSHVLRIGIAHDNQQPRPGIAVGLRGFSTAHPARMKGGLPAIAVLDRSRGRNLRPGIPPCGSLAFGRRATIRGCAQVCRPMGLGNTRRGVLPNRRASFRPNCHRPGQ